MNKIKNIAIFHYLTLYNLLNFIYIHKMYVFMVIYFVNFLHFMIILSIYQNRSAQIKDAISIFVLVRN